MKGRDVIHWANRVERPLFQANAAASKMVHGPCWSELLLELVVINERDEGEDEVLRLRESLSWPR